MRTHHVLIVIGTLGSIPLAPPLAGAQTPFVNETADGSPNSVGAGSSLALDAQGNPHVSYLDATTFDLKYARKSGGVWTIETADGSANWVGGHTSLALDAQGNPHVSYHDFTTGDLKYARKSGGVWTIETADSSASSVGEYNSLALDAQGNPHVSYLDANTFDLKYARKSGGVWTIETADGSPIDEGYTTSLALDAQGNPHVSYLGSSLSLKYARNSGGVWTTETVDGSGLMGYTSLALDAQGNPHVSYLDGTASDLKYARKSGGVWTIETADGSANDVAYTTSLALDAQGNPHVSYWDNSTSDLKYARKSGWVWTTETADGSANIVGLHTSLALDAQGNPFVSYLDATTFDLKYAHAAVRITSPSGAATWAVGSLQNVKWSGAGPADVYLSHDGGATYRLIRANLIDTSIELRVPPSPTEFALVRRLRESPFSSDECDSFISIDATIVLAKFDAMAAADGRSVALAWKTEPGPEAQIRYRVEKAAGAGAGGAGGGGDDDAFTPIHAGLLDESELVDPDAAAGGARYRLVAVNGLGEEYVLAKTSVGARLGEGRLLGIAPNPAPDGVTRALFRVPFPLSDIELAVYDTSGRRVRVLASGARDAGIHEASWDGRDADGREVAPGAYFLRLFSSAGFRVTERVTVLR